MSDVASRGDFQAGEIELRNVTKDYGEWPSVVTAVKDCSFVVERGKFTVLIGPSGCGKTTLIDMMAGYEQPTSGEILLNGERVARAAVSAMIKALDSENTALRIAHLTVNLQERRHLA